MILCTDGGGNILLILQTNISSELKSMNCSISTVNYNNIIIITFILIIVVSPSLM